MTHAGRAFEATTVEGASLTRVEAAYPTVTERALASSW